MAGPLPGLQFGENIGKSSRRFVEDRRDDKRFKTEEKQMGLQETAIEAKTADIGREQEAAQLDHDYGLFKRDMSTGMQAFGMDDRNYQDAIDTVNKQYGLDTVVTHRVTPQGTTYDMTFTDPKSGEPVVKNGMTKRDLGSMLQMSLNPASWFENQTAKRDAAATASASARHDIDKIDQKGKWDVLVASMKNKGKGADQSLKYQKQAYKMAADAFGKLGEDGTFTFGDEYNAQYASLTSAYSATLAEAGGKGFRDDLNKAHAHALRRVKDLIETNTAEVHANNPEMDEEEVNAIVRDKVSDQLQALSEDVKTQGMSSMASPEERQAGIKENSDEIQKLLEDAGKSEEEIKKAMGDAYTPRDDVKPGLDEAAPIDTESLKAKEMDLPAEEKKPEAAPEEPEKLESAAQKGDVGLTEKPIKFGSRKKEADVKAENKSIVKSHQQKRSDKGMSDDIKKARGLATFGAKKEPVETTRLKKVRDEAARRVIAAFEGGGVVTSKIILQAAINSGKLPRAVEDEVKATLGDDAVMVAEK